MAIASSRKALILPTIIMVLMIGSAAAYWNEQLIITGEVTTGTYDSELSLPIVPPGDNEPPEKDIGKVTAEIIGPPYDTIEVTVTNAYPCYEAWVLIGVHHIGSVPCIIKEIDTDTNVPDELDIWITKHPDYPEPIGAQLHGCDEIFFYLHVHVFEDEAAIPPIEPEQGKTYEFAVTIVTIQYNYVPPG